MKRRLLLIAALACAVFLAMSQGPLAKAEPFTCNRVFSSTCYSTSAYQTGPGIITVFAHTDINGCYVYPPGHDVNYEFHPSSQTTCTYDDGIYLDDGPGDLYFQSNQINNSTTAQMLLTVNYPGTYDIQIRVLKSRWDDGEHHKDVYTMRLVVPTYDWSGWQPCGWSFVSRP